MSKEYYPRISTLSDNTVSFNKSVNDQIYLVLLILGPLIAFFLTFSDQILLVLYSDKFINAGLLMALCMVGIIFEAPSWCMGYVFLAKGDNKEFLFYETITKVQKILTDIACYLLWDLVGLGISFIVSYVYYTFQCIFLCKKRYDLLLDRRLVWILIIYSVVSFVLIMIFVYANMWVRFSVGAIIIMCSCLFSYRRINSIINIPAFIRNQISKRKSSNE